MSQRTEALAWKFSGNQFAVNDETGTIIHWDGPDPQPDEAAIVQAETEYAVVAPALEQRADDLRVLREAGKDLALVLTELVDWTLANTAMQASDFTLNVKQAYLDLKAIADRVKT